MKKILLYIFLFILGSKTFLWCPVDIVPERIPVSLKSEGINDFEFQNGNEGSPHLEEPKDIPGTMPPELKEPLSDNNYNSFHDDSEDTVGDVLYHQENEGNEENFDFLSTLPDQSTNPGLVGQDFPMVAPVETPLALVNQENVLLDVPTKTSRQWNDVIIDQFITSVSDKITELNQKEFAVFADYIDPLTKLENAKSMLEDKIESWGDALFDSDGLALEQVEMLDAMIDKLSSVEDLLQQVQSVMQSKLVKDITNLYEEALSIEKDVNSAKGSSFWGKDGSLRKAAERIERLQLILEGASKASPDRLPVSDTDSYLHTIDGIKDILQATEIKLQKKQISELKKNNLIERAKNSYDNVSKLTGIADYSGASGKKAIKDAKQVVKELDNIITTDLDYQDHILQEHDNKAFEMLTRELIDRNIIKSASGLTLELLQRPDVIDISKQLFEKQSSPQEWQDSVDYVLIHRLKVKIEEKVQRAIESLKVMKKEYGSGAIKNMKKNQIVPI